MRTELEGEGREELMKGSHVISLDLPEVGLEPTRGVSLTGS